MLESKIKKAAFFAACDLILISVRRNPERCARNLTELVIKTYPEVLNNQKPEYLNSHILKHCEDGDINIIKEEIYKLCCPKISE